MSRIAAAILWATVVVPAQSVIVPNSSATGPSSTLVLNNPLRESANPRTYMMGINASELSAIPIGSLINGVSMRSGHTTSNPASWPAADVSWTQYDVYIGNVIPTASWTSTYANNWVGTPVHARQGPMVVQANTYANTVAAPAANPWGEFYWDFQVPFLYLGGDLGIMFTHPGSTAATGNSIFLEQVNSNTAVHGQAITFAGYQATTASSTNYAFCVIRVHYGYGSPAGCPGTGGMSPNLVQNGDVTGGGTIMLSVGNAPPSTVGLFIFGFGRIAIPAPNGCNVLTPPAVTLLTFFDAVGRARQTINVPPAVTGAFNAQAMVLDPGAPGGFTLTNGVEPHAF